MWSNRTQLCWKKLMMLTPILLAMISASARADRFDAARDQLSQSYNDFYSALAKSDHPTSEDVEKYRLQYIDPAVEAMHEELRNSIANQLAKAGVKEGEAPLADSPSQEAPAAKPQKREPAGSGDQYYFSQSSGMEFPVSKGTETIQLDGSNIPPELEFKGPLHPKKSSGPSLLK